jgi:hypothetical protein
MQGTVVILKEKQNRVKGPVMVTESLVGSSRICICEEDGSSAIVYIQEVERYATKEELVKFVSALKKTHPHMIQHLIKYVTQI